MAETGIIIHENTATAIDTAEPVAPSQYVEPTENEKELVRFVQDHTDRWRDYRDQNHMDDWERYERVFRGIWADTDKQRASERSRIISPATQQAIETRHAEIMEAIFGQGEFFDITDDVLDENKNPLDVEQYKKLLNEDFKQDKILKSIDQIELMAEIYGTGIGEIIVGEETVYKPHTQILNQMEKAYGVKEEKRVSIKLNPINPKNFLHDPNGTSIDDCMGVAIERYVSIHKVKAGIANGTYRKVDIDEYYKDETLEPTQEDRAFRDQKVLLLTYYGLVPAEYLTNKDDENVVELFPEESTGETDDYDNMVEAIVVLANDVLLKCEKTPYMMQDRPVIAYQDDTVPNRLLGRGTAEKAFNMQVAIDSQMRSHLDSLALTTAPMVAMDATRLPRGAKFEVKPGKSFMTNGNPQEILYPFHFGTNDGQAMNTSKEFERMLLMATATLDSQGMVTPGSRDAGGLAPAVAGIIKKYKRTLINFQEDFLIPFIKKAAWRFMQFDPKRYPSVDVKFIATGTMGIIAREYEQQQIAFLIQTLGGNSPLTPILMKGIVKNSSLSTREQMIADMDKLAQGDPAQKQAAQAKMMADLQLVQAQIAEINSKASEHQAIAQKTTIEAQLAPQTVGAEVQKVQEQIKLEQIKAAHQMDQEVTRSTNDVTIEKVQADQDIRVKVTQAELDRQAMLEKETLRLEYEDKWKMAAIQKDLILAGVQDAPQKVEENNAILTALQTFGTAIQAMADANSTPKKLVIGPDGSKMVVPVKD